MRSALVFLAVVAGAVTGSLAQDHAGLPVFDVESMQIKVSGAMQFRYTTNSREDVAAPDEDFSSGFSFRRLRPKVSGQTPDKRFYFEVEGEGSRTRTTLIDAFMQANLDDGRWRVRVGQFTLSFVRENYVSNTKQLAMDRSSISANASAVSGERVQGIELRYQDGKDRAFLTLFDGSRGFNQRFNSSRKGEGVSARYERLIAGEGFKAFDQITAPRGTPLGVLVGGALKYEQATSGGDRFAWTADLSTQHDGLSFMLSGIGSVAEDLNLLGRSEHAWGVAAQAGVYVSETVEPYVRYEWGTTSNDREPDFSFVTAGFNWYIIGFVMKFSADVSYAFNEVTSTWDRGSNGLLIDTPGQDGQVIVRSQIQLLF